LREKNIYFCDCKESHDLPPKPSFEINERYERKKKKPTPTRKLIATKEIDNMEKVYDFWHDNFARVSFDTKSAVVKYSYPKEDLVIIRHVNKTKGHLSRRFVLKAQPKNSTADTIYFLYLVIFSLR
jgi:hypothetical protein